MTVRELQPGTRVRVTQRIVRRDGDWSTEAVGTIVSTGLRPTGAWYAYGKNSKYWLMRIELQTESGEITLLTMDRNTEVTVLET